MLLRRLLLLVALVTNPALGEPVPGGQVRVERTERALGCPGEAAFVRAALAQGTAPTTTPATPLEVSVQFDGDQSSLQASIRVTGAKTGERLLRTEGTDCAKLAEAAAVVVAVLLDLVPPKATASFEAPAPAAPPPARIEPQPAAVPPPRAPPATPPRALPHGGAAAPLHVLVRGEG